MPPLEVIWALILLLAIVFVASAFLLRLGCSLANLACRWTSRSPQVPVPSYRSSLAIVFTTVFVLGLATGFGEELLAPVAGWIFDQTTVHHLGLITQWLLFVVLVASGLRTEQKAPTSFVVVASCLHAILLIAFVHTLAACVIALGLSDVA